MTGSLLLVYIAALAPDETETSQRQQNKFPVTDVLSHIEVADGRIWLKPDGVSFFCGDLPKAEQKLVWATQSVPVPDLFMQKLDGVAWRRKPSWFIVSSQDRTVQPEPRLLLREHRQAEASDPLRPLKGTRLNSAD